MNYRIENKDKHIVFGIEKIFKESNKNKIPKFWAECHKNGSYEKLYVDAGGKNSNISNNNEKCIINAICGYRVTEKNTFPYMICAEKTENSNTKGYLMVEIPQATWAIFKSDLSTTPGDGLSKIISYAYKDWLPSSGYDLDNAPDLEYYYTSVDGRFYEEYWIAIKKH